MPAVKRKRKSIANSDDDEGSDDSVIELSDPDDDDDDDYEVPKAKAKRSSKKDGNAKARGGSGESKNKGKGQSGKGKVDATTHKVEKEDSEGGGGGAGRTSRGAARKASASMKMLLSNDSSDEEEIDRDDDEPKGEEEEESDNLDDDDDDYEEVKKGKGAKGKGAGQAAASPRGTGRASGAVRPPPKINHDPDQVLKGVRGLKKDMVANKNSKVPTLASLGLTGKVTEVKEMNAEAVGAEIESIALAVTKSILAGKGFFYEIPTRSSANQRYVPELDRIVLAEKMSHRAFVSTAAARKTAITTRVIQLVHEVLGKGIHITKRDLFYTDVKLFKDQGESDTVLDDVACMIGCTRSCLNVVASDKGLVVGRVSFREDGDFIDCTRMGVGGKAIPPYTDKITEIVSDADFILLVEKEAAYMRLAEDRFYNRYPCIVITAKGQPDVATRLFLKRLKSTLNIPVMGLVDSDPYGLKILSVYMSGSKNMSYDSASLTTPDIRWLGVRPSDLDRYNIPEQCRLDMTDHDIKTGKELLKEEFIKKNPEWYAELELMIKTKKKAEIQALSAFGFQYLTQTYLPQKLQAKDWI